MPKIAVIGTTIWGMTLGVVLANKGLQVRLWARTEEEADKLRNAGLNSAVLSDTVFPSKLSIISSPDKAMAGVEAVILAVPAQTMRQNMKLVAPCLKESMLIVNAAKGLEIGSGKRMTQVREQGRLILEAVGLEPLEGMDGRSFLPLLKGQKQDGRDHVYTYIYTTSSQRR